MKTRLLFSAVGIPILLILLIVLPDWGTLIFCAVLAGLAAHEMICAVGDGGRFPIYGAVFGAAAVVFIYFFGLSRMTAALWGVMVLLAFLDLIITRGGKYASDFMDVLSLIFSAALLPLLFSSLIGLRRAEFERIYGQRADKRRKLSNGGMVCTLYRYLPKYRSEKPDRKQED